MTKSDIVKAAFSAWESDMYKSMSLSVLASYLGVSKTALYRHFKNKKAIVDAMFAAFFDDYFASIVPSYEKALNEKDEQKGFFILVRGITEFYVRNKSAFIFSLHRLNDPSQNMALEMQKRGINILNLPFLVSLEKNNLLVQSSVSISIFFTAMFFLLRIQNPSEEQIQNVLDRTEHQISCGFGFSKEDLLSIDYDELDELIAQSVSSEVGSDNLLKAVANAITQAGAKDASMEMVAKHAGISKSGLYFHFKNKEDMLRQFFSTEFEKLYGDLEMFPKTEKPEEQLYLLIGSTIKYLQARPEIMIALDWIRTQRIDLELSMPEAIIARFSDPHFLKHDSQICNHQVTLDELPHFVIFCIMRVLKNNYFLGKEILLSKENIRFLYIFLISGIKNTKGGKV
jgi:AcrR family transcriptional regulator